MLSLPWGDNLFVGVVMPHRLASAQRRVFFIGLALTLTGILATAPDAQVGKSRVTPFKLASASPECVRNCGYALKRCGGSTACLQAYRECIAECRSN
jgi:hypothetical protein